MSSSSAQPSFRTGASYATGPPPGSFSSELRTMTMRSETPRPTFSAQDGFLGELARTTSEQRQADLRDQIVKEEKIKTGSENLLEALNSKSAKQSAKQSKDQKKRVEAELNTANRKLAALRQGLEDEIARNKEEAAVASGMSPKPGKGRLSFLFRANEASPTTPDVDDGESETESPTFVLAEILQALEAEGMLPEYYVEYANRLVELFKRNPTLKFDLAWPIFAMRVQTMLLSDSREVVAAGYRVLRYVMTDRRSLQTIRAHQTDYLVIVSLVKQTRASVEREQALKFVRAFLEVKDGVKEISRSIVRILVAIAEHTEDRLRNIAILTLSEILIRDPVLLKAAGGLGALTDALGEGVYLAAESVAVSFLYLLDLPSRRKHLTHGREIELAFASFTEIPMNVTHHEEKLKANVKVISALLKSWSGLLTLCMDDFMATRSLVASLFIPMPHLRNIVLELFIDLLRIKPPAFASSFLAGRRLTTYQRVTRLKSTAGTTTDSKAPGETDDDVDQMSLVEHYTAVLLAVFIHSGLVDALMHAEQEWLTPPLKRKTTLVLSEVLRMASEMLPPPISEQVQILPQLVQQGARMDDDDRFDYTSTIYQIESVTRTIYRFAPSEQHGTRPTSAGEPNNGPPESSKAHSMMQVDEPGFRQLILETHILSTVNFTKWRWDIIQNIIEGPLLNAKRLDEAIRASKFLHRLQGFYRPFKRRFADVKNTKPNQRYVRVGVALMRTLLNNPEGAKYLAESKLIRQLAECLAQFDRMSGIMAVSPIFTPERMNETLSGGYFSMLGALSRDPKGMLIMERWKMFNMFYHIVELKGRDDLIKTLLGGMDYTLEGHLRIILGKAMTCCSKDIRIFATRILRKYAVRAVSGLSDTDATQTAEWAIRLLVTQLYDPSIEVCEAAVKILEESCNLTSSLEYVVKCRPALDHLGEIGAPLLLRFLSSSVGYHYLDGLDYITREMDDWFLGRNDTYVALVEASLAKAFAEPHDKPGSSSAAQYPGVGHHSHFDEMMAEHQEYGLVPPHFYRELTRTHEGVKLLREKGHFDEFAATIHDFGREDDDAETILKLKGCLWAVGNVGSMELGAPFLETTDVVRDVVQIAENSLIMSVRGTAVFVLGLISRSVHGQEILLEYGWDGATNMMGEALGFAIPKDLRKLFSVPDWTREAKAEQRMAAAAPFDAAKIFVRSGRGEKDPVKKRLFAAAENLGNSVLSKKAAGELNALKSRYPAYFRRPSVFRTVLSILEAHHFRLHVCRFLIDLFDKDVMRQIVLEEESDEEAGDRDDVALDIDSPISPINSMERRPWSKGSETRPRSKGSGGEHARPYSRGTTGAIGGARG
ncbi:cytosolic regulator pianissimo [Eremomyces bilateralis CBS 781.70]|uniref:Cytosolic regulator pianissimo n=1 Tax=Eremomyces bilateralis CBS 781.70 TaxID=1392243 RepID=A0A6G1G439_9PEZI|nr:cytosolic regulator pianissimo [Eremomyces bilateralis CBS 781.70]KAF1812857.1 cytosolic regulator pianissimo [Eremomyces bilateralis CBS 781.70]